MRSKNGLAKIVGWILCGDRATCKVQFLAAKLSATEKFPGTKDKEILSLDPALQMAELQKEAELDKSSKAK